LDDPNVALHAALKNGLLAEACGIVTPWRATAPRQLLGDYLIHIDIASLAADPAVITVSTQPTAFRRKGSTHPLSFADIGKSITTNSGLAFLTDDQGNPRYRATTIHAETAVFQGTILQQKNSISNDLPPSTIQGPDYKAPRDDRPPQLLGEDQFGINEPEAGGLTISAPIEDLTTPQALASNHRETTLPCLFLEDVWSGFRLDIAAESKSQLLSIHQQTQEITFGPRKVRGNNEDFFAREQPADPAAGYSSTEIARYIGLNTAQAQDYMKFLGTYRAQPPEPGAPFAVAVTGYKGATPLRFGNIYRYRLRNVFLGGISFSDQDQNLDQHDPNYTQRCPFFRARAYRPGEFVSRDADLNKTPGAAGRTIFLTPKHPNAHVWLVPTPIDVDSARYHGVFLASKAEPKHNTNRAFVTDIGNFFKKEPPTLNYYLHPEVSEIVVRVVMLNGDSDAVNQKFVFQNGSYCELLKHLQLAPINFRYGPDGQWANFHPIRLSFSAVQARRPSVTAGVRRLHIRVPVAAYVEVSILPVMPKSKLLNVATQIASSTELAIRDRLGGAFENWTPVPTIAELMLRVIHCNQLPREKPSIVSNFVQLTPTGQSILLAERAPKKDTAELSGRLELDSASTGQIRLQAAWHDIDDSPVHGHYVLKAGTAVSKPRSVNFDRYSPPTGSAIAQLAISSNSTDMLRATTSDLENGFDVQCAENKIFLGSERPQGSESQIEQPCVLNFGDTRRKQAFVNAVATSRYKNHFPPGAASSFETRSDNVQVDVPASMYLAVPDISHAVPLAREITEGDATSGRQRRLYAMRIYIRRPWFLSGPCERLAIGCRAGDTGNEPSATLDKYITQWGEDPLERQRLAITGRAPRASDFSTLTGATDKLDTILYPSRSIEGTAPVIYRDNIARPDSDDSPPVKMLSLASYGVRWDKLLKVWYCDIAISEEFVGWCGMALYRHQPHALEGCHLSQVPAWVYGAVLHGEQIAWLRRDGKLHVTIGPIFDKATSFSLDFLAYRDGVSDDLQRNTNKRVELQKYVAYDKVYFEGIVPEKDQQWSLTKIRFGREVASLSLSSHD
jgi:hypothetical protein